MDTKSTNKSNFFSEWLEKLQQESWQLELLISGLALFGIWQSKSLLHHVDYYLAVNATNDVSIFIGIFVSMLWAGWAIFLINLLIHIIIRGFWIGAIGLRYVSGDVDYENLNYSERFTNYFKKRHGTFDDYIERLEKLSSVLFSFTFLLFFILLSFVMYLLVFAISVALLSRIFPADGQNPSLVILLFGMLYFGMGIIVMIDFFSLGVFKKVKEKSISNTFYFVYRFYEIVSLSFIYRPLLLNFIDNRYTKRLFFLAIPYSMILLGVQGFKMEMFQYFPDYSFENDYDHVISSNSINWNHYDDLRKEHHHTFNLEESEIIKSKIESISLAHYEFENQLSFFLEYQESDNAYLKNNIKEVPAFRKKGLRHWFMKNTITDSLLIAMSKEEIQEHKIVRKIVEGKLDGIENERLIQEFSDIENIKQARDMIHQKYERKRDLYYQEKLNKIKSTLLGSNQLSIDGNSINDELECYFYVHPNMHEKGLLCYLPIDSLSIGRHLLNLKKKSSRVNCEFDCIRYEMNVPFQKVK